MLIILTSYQEYMVKCARNNSGNWDFKFYNITYEQAKEIEKNKNIKEIGKIYKLGITKSISENPFGKTDIELRAYDRKALEHINLNILIHPKYHLVFHRLYKYQILRYQDYKL